MTLKIFTSIEKLEMNVRSCSNCETQLPLGAKPILQISTRAKVLIAGQAPGKTTHDKGIPFDDPSGDRLRQWLNIDRETFYNRDKIAILPMGLCYPGTGTSGDLAPRKECIPLWRQQLLSAMPNIEITLLIGQYAQHWHLNNKQGVTENVKAWRSFLPTYLPLPHPSPRNNIWLRKNPWFEEELLPYLKHDVKQIILGN